jgi:thioredoxin-like negative regulator of GroEL
VSAAVARRYFVRGREALRRGALDDAQRELEAALQLSPSFVEARVGYALTLQRTDPPRAAQSLRTGLAAARRPADRRALLCALGDVLVQSGDFPGAEAAYAEAAALPGATARLHDRLSRLRARTGRFADALSELLLAARGG